MRIDTVKLGIKFLEDKGYEVLHAFPESTEFVECIKDGNTCTISVRKVKIKFSEYRFRHTDSQRYFEENIKQVWVLGDQVGWNRDHFKLDRKF